jgi:glycine/D-amino acid oxidase-like deaminating enzyme
VKSARKFGATFTIPGEAESLERIDGHFVVGLSDGGQVEAHAVVLATGVRYRRLDIPGMDRFGGLASTRWRRCPRFVVSNIAVSPTPVSTNPRSSSAVASASHRVRGSDPINTKRAAALSSALVGPQIVNHDLLETTVALHESHGDRALAHGGRHTFHRATAHVPQYLVRAGRR